MSERFMLPDVGPLATVHFPPIARGVLPNGARIWCIERHGLPAVTSALVVHHGTSADPANRPGLTSVVADLLEEGAGGRDAIALADALARIGGLLSTESGSDSTTIAITALSRHLDRALSYLSDIAMRPHFTEADFHRVRELRQSRLRQLSQSASASADRAFIQAVFGSHPYGHGMLGTIASLDAMTLDEARRHWGRIYAPTAATFVVVGDVAPEAARDAVARAFGEWAPTGEPLPPMTRSPARHLSAEVHIVNRPGASQSELRVGHLGPARDAPDYHALVVLNAILGGQFMSRINRNLRETRGITYGATTLFDMRRHGGAFSCVTGVQSSATGVAVEEILKELRAIRDPDAVTMDELERATAWLTRGYVRQFETTGQLARAAVVLASYGLPDDTFDQFVPGVSRVTRADVTAAAARYLDPDGAVVVIVGDEEGCRREIEGLHRPISTVTPEF
jgi:predicted Zn-dependent peptidase